jgi:putative ABC transport system permease protein
MLMAAVIGLLLIACVNLANTQLGRAVSREREAAVRSALGASSWQLLWSSFSESLVLSIVGGAAGILLAWSALALFARYAPIDLPRMAEIQPDLSVLVFALVAVVGSALLFGVMPAINLVRTDPQKALQQNSTRTQGSRQGRRLRWMLIGLQVFGCTALLLVTGLFAKSLSTILRGDRGFDAGNIVTAEVSLRARTYQKDQQRIAFDDSVLTRLRALPGVTSVALVSAMPLEGQTWTDGIRRPDKPVTHPPLWNMRWVSPQYFEVVRERLVAGRFFEERDRDSNNAVISESSAKAGWPGETRSAASLNGTTNSVPSSASSRMRERTRSRIRRRTWPICRTARIHPMRRSFWCVARKIPKLWSIPCAALFGRKIPKSP